MPPPAEPNAPRLTLDFVHEQIEALGGSLMELGSMVQAADGLEPLDLARLMMDLDALGQGLEGIMDRLDVASAPRLAAERGDR